MQASSRAITGQHAELPRLLADQFFQLGTACLRDRNSGIGRIRSGGDSTRSMGSGFHKASWCADLTVSLLRVPIGLHRDPRTLDTLHAIKQSADPALEPIDKAVRSLGLA